MFFSNYFLKIIAPGVGVSHSFCAQGMENSPFQKFRMGMSGLEWSGSGRIKKRAAHSDNFLGGLVLGDSLPRNAWYGGAARMGRNF